MEEPDGALRTMKPGKPPVLDGLPQKIYRTFKIDLLPHLQHLVEYCSKEGEIPPSWRGARLVLIPKEGKDQKTPAAYRPLSILNMDYKILASTPAHE